ncbi:competence type IV pilus major pilin ComGC [Sutcliffiella halmapala]|uniref:competence type IV pilus major pilin ComGC n=1 Tax=Sutcliffiella halmapala TaxID=79882 RepID=UPI001F1DDA4F|nr:competence type IV pilus major pilin ComGC [Sutcliffiella halmapala]
MRKMMKDENGFTLVEMLLVMLVITVLLLIMIPNVTKNTGIIGDKGCDALVKMVEAQMQAYRLETGSNPTSIQDLNDPEYLGDKFDEEDVLSCPNGKVIIINGNEVDTVEES